MSDDAARDLKDRLRADLKIAMKGRRPAEAAVIRTLIAALDNAEAPPIGSATAARPRPTEIERLQLSVTSVRNVLLGEVREREHAVGEMERLGLADRAEALRAEIAVARRYLD